MDETEVLVKVDPARLLISHKMVIPTNEEVPGYFDKAVRLLMAFIEKNQLQVISPFMTIWHQGPDVMENEIVETTFEVDKLVPSSEDIQVYVLPETLVAAYTHRGKFDEFTIGHKILAKWIAANGYSEAGGYREIYMKHEESNRNDTVTEIQFPVIKVNS